MFKNRYVGGAILLLLMINARLGFVHIPLNGYIYYFTGAYLALSFKGIEYYRNRIFTILSLLFFVFLFALRFNILGNTYVRLLFFLSCWFALNMFSLQNDYPWWMKITFFTYVGHDLFLEAYEKIILVVFGKGTIFALLDYILAPLLVFCTLVAIAAILRKFAPGIWKVCTGMR